ncbi:serine/threonine-protein kinase [Streptomyces sp. NPDC059828]|uniref:serine/threonine-protein kinase n=1 Tax=Streptomyces sp. NPDC059828 TaxID=3346965 RepID=UPI00365201BF
MQPLDAGEPRTIGAYRLLGRLGAGGMGRVYLARTEGGRTVAVKVVHPHFALDEQFRARFRREVAASRRVGGAWTAPVLDADPEAPVPWVATGYVAGPALGQAVAEHGPLPERTVRTLGAGLAEALAAVHALGLVHRDVKPSNVLLALDGPRLIDFGIARATDATASLTTTGVSVGSPGYMAPEQIVGTSTSTSAARGSSAGAGMGGAGGVTGAADVFSLGAVLAYAATGTAPFPGDSSAALLYKVVHEEPELGALSGELREVVAACLAKDPAARPAPQDVTRRLAPGGAAALVAAGWLPGPVVEQVSRTAVRLLDLEPSPQDPAASGPVPFTHEALGVFGPPMDPSFASPPPMPSTPPPVPASPGRLSLSVTTSAERAEGDRPGGGRKVSCTVALAVAGALAAVTVGAGFLLDLFPGTQGGGTDANDSAAAPPRSSASGTPPDPQEVQEVPKAFTGTWKGQLTQDSGLSGGSFSAVITEGRQGQDVVRTASTLGPFACRGVGKLTSATAKEIRVAERSDPDHSSSGGVCTSGTTTVTYVLNADGTLRYRSQEDAAGNPEATLTKSR